MQIVRRFSVVVARPGGRLLAVLLLMYTGLVQGQSPDSLTVKLGRQVFATSCAACHQGNATIKAPSQAVLGIMTPRAILAALETGKMRTQAGNLTADERKAVAQWLTGRVLKENALPSTAFTVFTLPKNRNGLVTYSGWGGDLAGTGFRTEQQAGITPANVGKLRLKWAFAFPEATQMRCKPAVVGDWLVVGSQFGEVFAIQKQSGKIGWQFQADGPVRGAISVVQDQRGIRAYFADNVTNVYALDVRTGKLLWKQRAGAHPQASNTGSVVVHENRVFVPISSIEVAMALDPNYPCCSSSGELVALDATSGQLLWRHRVIAEKVRESGKKKNGQPFLGPSGAPVWCSPTVDVKRGLVYIGTGENYSNPFSAGSDAIQAVDLKTGRLVWSFQATSADTWNLACPGNPNCPDTVGPDHDFGMAPILVKDVRGTERLVVGQKSGVVHALNPDTGKPLWQTRVGKGGMLGGIHWGMATDGKLVYAANADNIWAIDRRDSTRQAAPGLHALDLATGAVVWTTPAPPCERQPCVSANSAAPTVVPGLVFGGTLDGHIRAYETATGRIVWDYNTIRDYQTVNGIPGKGGSLDGPSPVVSDGMLFVNSGYGMFSEMPGNVLLAFGVED
ncbi:PQQ-binding-like beta-propeller repeat protein [Larkinella sp. VNQ87]|uniref:outer membrane protein assembly factor BamB family protein n=1 Tax=Larkinella sp. VNQ87 TaxID=3400921 RepID=UPI003C02B146